MFENVMYYYSFNKKYIVLNDENQESFIIYDTVEDVGKVIDDDWVIDALMEEVILNEDTVIKKCFYNDLKAYLLETMDLDDDTFIINSRLLKALEVVNVVD